MVKRNPDSGEYADKPCYPELAAIILVGALHVATEIITSDATARLYNAIISVVFLCYLVWRARRSKDAVKAWGMRTDNFWQALREQLTFGAVGVAALLGFGIGTGTLPLPGTFWLILGLYPIWGIAQQFALQSLIGRNLKDLLSKPIAIAVVASALFATAHLPLVEYVILTAVAGVFLTLIYQRTPNLWAVGIVHGILGSLAVYIILRQDPGAGIWAFISGT